jgi:hypothetical protein
MIAHAYYTVCVRREQGVGGGHGGCCCPVRRPPHVEHILGCECNPTPGPCRLPPMCFLCLAPRDGSAVCCAPCWRSKGRHSCGHRPVLRTARTAQGGGQSRGAVEGEGTPFPHATPLALTSQTSAPCFGRCAPLSPFAIHQGAGLCATHARAECGWPGAWCGVWVGGLWGGGLAGLRMAVAAAWGPGGFGLLPPSLCPERPPLSPPWAYIIVPGDADGSSQCGLVRGPQGGGSQVRGLGLDGGRGGGGGATGAIHCRIRPLRRAAQGILCVWKAHAP